MQNSDVATIQALRGDVALQIARRLRALRLTQVEAARLLDIPQPTLSKIVNGRVADLSLELLIRTAVRVGLSLVMQTGSVPAEAGAYVSCKGDSPATSGPKSRLSERARSALVESARRLTPEQRLDAMLEQTQLISELHAAGRSLGQIAMRATRPGQSPLLLLDLIQVLKREGVEYAVVGALAAAVYGTIRGSADAEALVSLTVSKLSSLSRVFVKMGFSVDLRRGDADDPIPVMLLVSDAYQNRVDLLGGLRGIDPQALSRAVRRILKMRALRCRRANSLMSICCAE
jgi:predicted XRE-type DNA-binding protein